MTTLQYGETAAREVSKRVAAPQTTLAALRLVPTKRCSDGQVCAVNSDTNIPLGTEFIFNAASVLTDDGQLVIAPGDGGTGRWLRVPGYTLLQLPFTFATADATILLTLQAGMLLLPSEFQWRIDADMTGGSSSAIGVSSSTVSGQTTKGNLLGGATGDVLATLVHANSPLMGTAGTNMDTIAHRRFRMKSGDTIRFDRITSAFTAGSGAVMISGNLELNNGA